VRVVFWEISALLNKYFLSNSFSYFSFIYGTFSSTMIKVFKRDTAQLKQSIYSSIDCDSLLLHIP